MEHRFSQVPRIEIPRSTFDRSHRHMTSFDADYLVQVLVDDCLPGDTFSVDMNFFCRLATPQFPIMDQLWLESFFFFTPYRLIWENFEKMHGAQDNPADTIAYSVPVLGSATTQDLTTGANFDYLCDYFGLPHKSSVDLSEMSAFPFRAYNLIWNEWFRDQNLQNSVSVSTDNGPDSGSSEYSLLKRGKRHDYFTAALPWPQKGDAVDIPWGGANLAVTPTSAGEPSFDGSGQTDWKLVLQNGAVNVQSTATGGAATNATWNTSGLEVDITANSLGSINDLRLAFQTQRLLERDARAGTRYTEMILSHFGVTVPDFRLQRPEFLGGGSSPINITPVPQTTFEATPTYENAKGSLAAFGTVSGRHGFTASFQEHGVLIGLVNVRGDITYSQGLERMWSKSTRYDFYYPVLAFIGEQSILNKEIFYQNTSADDDVFGYIPRYDEYRYKPSRLSSLMRPDNAASLDVWHLSEDFSTLPTLGASFILSNTGTPLDRAIAVSSQPHFIGDFYFNMRCARPMPVHGVPGNLDHF